MRLLGPVRVDEIRQFLSEGLRDVFFAPGNHVDGGDQFIGRAVLGQVAVSAGFYGLQGILLLGEDAQNERPQFRLKAVQLLEEVQPAHIGHGDV